ncbi:MAG: hypothetical protein KDA72_11310 [Planctomycetales bacterium]|nr:hypothetical protein [Planctomycetales bacterium]
MDYSVLLIVPFILLAGLALSTEAQRVVFMLLHRLSQLSVAAMAMAFSVLSLSPTLLPQTASDWMLANGLLNEVQLADSTFWFSRGLTLAAVGVVGVMTFSYMRNLVQVNQHLKDIEKLMGTVSSRIPEARNRRDGQGTLRKAVETMTEFFQR